MATATTDVNIASNNTNNNHNNNIGMAYEVPPNSPAPGSTIPSSMPSAGMKRRKMLEDANAFSAALNAKLKEAELLYRSLCPNQDEIKDKQHVNCAVNAYKKGLVMEREVIQMRMKEKEDADAKRARITHYSTSVPFPVSQQQQYQTKEQIGSSTSIAAAEKKDQATTATTSPPVPSTSPAPAPVTASAPPSAPAPSAVESR